MNEIHMTNDELLKYAIENGIIDTNHIQEQIEMNERKKYLETHNHNIWKGKDGYYRTYVDDEHSKRGIRLLKKKGKKALEDAIVDYYRQNVENPYIDDVFREWIDAKMRYKEIKKQSYDRYMNDYKRFFTKDARICNIRFEYITEYILEDFIRTSIAEKQLTAKSWSGLRTLILGIFKYAKKMQYTDISITQFMGDLELSRTIFQKKRKNDEDHVFTVAELNMIKSFILEDKQSLLNYGVLLAFYTGMRIGELSTLKWSDIKENSIYVQRTEIRLHDDDGHLYVDVQESTKTDAGFRRIIISDDAKIILNKIRKMNPFGEYVFMKDGKRIAGNLFTNRLYRICDNLHIKRRSMHKARATYGTMLYDAQVPKSVIISQMGHADIKTTEQYYYFDNKSDTEKEEYIRKVFNA